MLYAPTPQKFIELGISMCAKILMFIWKGNRLADWTDGPVSYEEHSQYFRLYSPTLQYTALRECVRPIFLLYTLA